MIRNAGIEIRKMSEQEKKETAQTESTESADTKDKTAESNDAAESEPTERGIGFFAGITLAIVGVVLLLVFIVQTVQKKGAENTLSELTSQANDVQTETETESEPADPDAVLSELGIEIPEKNLDWDALMETNEDIYAWIYIPETNVDYPVLQRKGDDSYYLEHNIDHSEGYPGCIYTEDYNSLVFDDPMTVVYGHNMRDGSMFRTLHYFEDERFFDENKYVYIYTPDADFVYEVWAAYETNDSHLFLAYDFVTPQSFLYYMQSVGEQRSLTAFVRDDIPVAMDERCHLLTLSTCVDGKDDRRYFVQGVLLNDPYRDVDEVSEGQAE